MVEVYVGAGIALAIVVFLVLSDIWVGATEDEVRSSRLPAAFDGFCIVQISDLHNQRFGPFQPRLMRLVRKARPDLIALTGDLTFEGRWSKEYILGLVRDLTALAPVYLVTGNHEAIGNRLSTLMEVLEGAGVEVLQGEAVPVERGGQSIVVAGIDDVKVLSQRLSSWREKMGLWRQALADLKARIPGDRYSVLLSHRPELLSDYASQAFDLVLSGHAHGGQIRIPFVGAVYSPSQGFFPRYTAGIYREGATTLVVSRGLGRSLFPFRVFNPPEVVIVRLRSQGGPQ